MCAPRCLLPGRSYLITRRCIQRQFLLTPSKRIVNEIVLFCLAHSAGKYKIKVHAAMFLSNHFHLVVTDTEGRLPQFMHWMDLYIAKCVNAFRGRWGALFEPESYSGVDLIEDDDVLDNMIYTLINPVQAGLVRWGVEWPGFRSRPEDIGECEYVVKRPEIFFSPKGSIPKEARLTFVKPEKFSHMSDADFRKFFRAKYRFLEESLQDKFDAEGREFLGQRKIRDQNPYESATSWEEKRGLDPRIAAKRKWPRIAAINDLRNFRKEYGEALERYRAGEHDVIFPAGTYWMRVHFGVRCYPAPQ
jgi:putative transposase